MGSRGKLKEGGGWRNKAVGAAGHWWWIEADGKGEGEDEAGEAVTLTGHMGGLGEDEGKDEGGHEDEDRVKREDEDGRLKCTTVAPYLHPI